VAYVTLRPGATVAEDTLRRWAREVIAEPAAAPKAVMIIEAIPVTAIGKPYKLPLRADATRRAVQDALAGFAGVRDVAATGDDGSVSVAVTLDASADQKSVCVVWLADALRLRSLSARLSPSRDSSGRRPA
jgi:fatty-acyl-CoA synthase